MTLVPSPTLEPQVHPASQARICPLSLAGQVVQPVHLEPNSLLEPGAVKQSQSPTQAPAQPAVSDGTQVLPQARSRGGP